VALIFVCEIGTRTIILVAMVIKKTAKQPLKSVNLRAFLG